VSNEEYSKKKEICEKNMNKNLNYLIKIIISLNIIFFNIYNCEISEYNIVTPETRNHETIIDIPLIQMVSVPANTTGFEMGFVGVDFAEPVHTVASINAFNIGKYEIKYFEWITVYNWAVNNGYTFANTGEMGGQCCGSTVELNYQHPVTEISWRDSITWCNALSELEGLTPVYYNAGKAHIKKNVFTFPKPTIM